MLVKTLIEKIQNVDYLTSEEKSSWLEMIPYMEVDELRELAYIIVWQEHTIASLHHEKDTLMIKLTQMFTEMNKYAVKIGKKEAYENMEINERKLDKKLEQELLKQLKNA